MKIYITGLPSGYEVEHLARLFYPMAPLTLTPPEPAEDCLWAEKTDTGLRVLVRQGEKSKMLEAPLPQLQDWPLAPALPVQRTLPQRSSAARISRSAALLSQAPLR